MNQSSNFIYFFFVFLLISCKPPTQVELSELDKENGLYLYSGNPYTGKVKDNVNIGQLKKGKKEGEWLYIDSGYYMEFRNVHEYYNYSHNKKNGLHYILNKNNDTLRLARYKDDKMHGVYKMYGKSIHTDEIILNEEGKYLDGKREGEWKEYGPESTIICIYKNGKKNGKYTEYTLDGEVRGNYKEDRKNGIWVDWCGECLPPKIVSLSEYENNKRIGLLNLKNFEDDSLFIERIDSKKPNGKKEIRIKRILYYDSNFDVCEKIEANYRREIVLDKNGKSVGEVKDYYVSDGLRWEGQISFLSATNSMNDIKQGKCTWYFNNGKKWIEANYRDNQKDGLVIIYDKDGNIKEKYTEEYVNPFNAKQSKRYSSDGKKCTRCYRGIYSGGSCDVCGTASAERFQETIDKLPQCSLCQGTGREKSRTSNESRKCPMCDGKGYRSY